jgi:tetratricopeptide (TPR) repeat protein
MLSSLGRGKDALAANERALRILRFGLGNSHPRVADQLNNRGEILTALGKLEDALSAYQAAREIFEREFGQHDPSVAYALTGVGSTLLNMGEPRQAVELLERALHIRERQDPDPGRLAETGFALARALWETGTDRSRALTLGRNALEASRRAPLSRGRTTEIAAWVARGESKRRTASASR